MPAQPPPSLPPFRRRSSVPNDPPPPFPSPVTPLAPRVAITRLASVLQSIPATPGPESPPPPYAAMPGGNEVGYFPARWTMGGLGVRPVAQSEIARPRSREVEDYRSRVMESIGRMVPMRVPTPTSDPPNEGGRATPEKEPQQNRDGSREQGTDDSAQERTPTPPSRAFLPNRDRFGRHL